MFIFHTIITLATVKFSKHNGLNVDTQPTREIKQIEMERAMRLVNILRYDLFFGVYRCIHHLVSSLGPIGCFIGFITEKYHLILDILTFQCMSKWENVCVHKTEAEPFLLFLSNVNVQVQILFWESASYPGNRLYVLMDDMSTLKSIVLA